MHSLDLMFFWVAFFAYLGSFLLYALYLAIGSRILARLGIAAVAAGFIPQTIGFFYRWALSEHVPLSNMYEYMGLMSWMAALSLFIVVGKYRKPVLGAFISPVVVMLMVTASMLPKDINQSLMPALQSYWLIIHVTLAALGSGAFAAACAVSLVYLLKSASRNPGTAFKARGVVWSGVVSMLVFPVILAVAGRFAGLFQENGQMSFVLGDFEYHGLGWFLTGAGLAFPFAGLVWYYLHKKLFSSKAQSGHGSGVFVVVIVSILIGCLLTGLLVKWGLIRLSEGSVWRVFEFMGVSWLLSIPIFFPVNLIVGVIGFEYLRRLDINIETLDEINYKTICFGYPLYMIGAIFAGAIWAEQAWGQFWGWDPKEVGALIIWLFYTGFLHARRYAAWRGERAAILSVFGLLMILLSFFGNYFFGGQHAYT